MSKQGLAGRGWAFPVKISSAGRLQYVEKTDVIERSIRIILDTEPGERVMLPDFGCGLRRFLARPNTSATRALIQDEVIRTLARWEQRIDSVTVEVNPHPQEASRVDIVIAFVHTRDRRPGNFVYPFYLE